MYYYYYYYLIFYPQCQGIIIIIVRSGVGYLVQQIGILSNSTNPLGSE